MITYGVEQACQTQTLWATSGRGTIISSLPQKWSWRVHNNNIKTAL